MPSADSTRPAPTELLYVEPPIDRLRALLAGGASATRAAVDHAADSPRRELGGRPPREWARLTREELGLPSGVPIVATGHQAAFWHPGVVAKLIVAGTLAAEVGGACFHVVVEQDVEPVARIRLPVRTDSSAGGELRERSVDLVTQPEGRVVGLIPPAAPIDQLPKDSTELAIPNSTAALRRVLAALKQRRSESNLAMQVTRAAFDLLQPMVPTMAVIGSSQLLATSLGRAVLEQIARDPETCARAYNAALDPAERAASLLRIERDRVEIPLWRIDDEGRRIRAWDDDLERFAAGEIRLMPRALLMTALLRLGTCDLFIHGLGGGTYDHAMERWIRAWLSLDVAAMAVATATLTLPLLRPELERAPSLAKAIATQRRAHFDPEAAADDGTTDSGGASAAKRRALAAIDALPRGSAERRAAWRAMHEELAESRRTHAESVGRAEESLALARRAARERPVAASRLWPFFLYEPRQFEPLIRAAKAGAGDRSPAGVSPRRHHSEPHSA